VPAYRQRFQDAWIARLDWLAKEGGDTLGISPLSMDWMGSVLLLLPVIVILVTRLHLALLLYDVIDSLG